MAKPFAEMSLDEVFDLEAQHSAQLGRSVVTAAGLKRNAHELAVTIQGLMKEKKRRRPALPKAAVRR